jgi:hypothetical protein
MYFSAYILVHIMQLVQVEGYYLAATAQPVKYPDAIRNYAQVFGGRQSY